MGTTEQLVRYVLDYKFEDIPPNIVGNAKELLLDSLGCALAGYSMDASKIFIEVMKEIGGIPEATVIGDGGKTACFSATYINTKLANLLDMDDVFWNVSHHSTGVIHSSLVVGERECSSGKDLLAAICIGFEVGARTSLAIGTIFNFDGKKLTYSTEDAYGFGAGIFGATVGAGRLIRLNQEELENAFGITAAYTPPPLLQKLSLDYSMCKYQLEWAAAAAVLATFLAKKGGTGPKGIFDDDFFAKSMGRKYFHPEFLIKDLGKQWYLPQTSLKPYPSCRHMHYALDLFKEILERNHLQPDEIEQVRIKGLSRLTRWPWVNPSPRDMFWGEFSVPYNIAVMAFGIRPGPDWYSAEAMKSSHILNFCKKVRIEPNPEVTEIENIPDAFIRRPTIVEVKTRDQVFTAQKESARGDGFSPGDRMGKEEVKDKFFWNAWRIIGQENAKAVADMIDELEDIKNVTELTSLLRKS